MGTAIQEIDYNKAQEAVERALELGSKQPRFNVVDPGKFYQSIANWVKCADLEEPAYAADSRKRDAWLLEFVRREPHLVSVVDSVSTINSNRSWTMVGGRNQVRRYTQTIHNWQIAPSVNGYRSGVAQASLGFYSTDMGALVEIMRDGKDGPWRGSASVDSTVCSLTASMEEPLKYSPNAGTQYWGAQDFFRVPSMAALEEKYNGLGFCAVSRCLELAKLMVAIYQHDLEMLMARAPRGLMIVNGVSEDQWRQAIKATSGELDAMEMRYFPNVIVLAQMGSEEISATFTALSQLPAGFDLKVWTDLLMYGYALAFGYDPREFWPVSSGSLGTATETETQHQKATGKGGLDFVLELQEQFQLLLPDSVQFEFEQRDDQGELIAAQVAQAWSDVAATLQGAKTQGTSLIPSQYIGPYLVDHLVIPPEWTEFQEESQAEDTDKPGTARYRERLLELDSVRRAIKRYPDEPIIRYRWPTQDERVIWQRGRDALARRSYPAIERQEENNVLYDQDGIVITEEDVDRAIANAARRTGDPELVGILNAGPEEEGETNG